MIKSESHIVYRDMHISLRPFTFNLYLVMNIKQSFFLETVIMSNFDKRLSSARVQEIFKVKYV